MANNHYFLILATIFSLLYKVTSYDDFRFSRLIQCLDVDSKGICQYWNQTTTLYRYSVSLYYCFPGNTYVLTTEGPRQFKSLKIQDQIFAMNLDSGKNQFSPIKTWLHRDTSSLMNYSLIQLQNSNLTFLGSDYHNIAFSNQNTTDFKFLKDLHPDDSLVSFSTNKENFLVKSIEKHQEKEGLFSPYTQAGTFYIFPEGFDIQKYKKNENLYPMILVHSLSQISNPRKNQQTVQKYLSLGSAVLGSSYQPPQEQEYVSPIISTFKLMFGNDWVSLTGDQIHHRYSSSGSYNSARNQEREQRKRKTIAVIALETILSHSLF